MTICPELLQQIAFFNQRPWALLNAMGELVAHGVLTEVSNQGLKSFQQTFKSGLEQPEGAYMGWCYRSLQTSAYAILMVYDDSPAAVAALGVLIDTQREIKAKRLSPLEHFEARLRGDVAYQTSEDAMFFEFLNVSKSPKKPAASNKKSEAFGQRLLSSQSPIQLALIQAPGLSHELLGSLIEALESKVLFAYDSVCLAIATRSEDHEECVNILETWTQEEFVKGVKIVDQLPIDTFEHVHFAVQDILGALEVLKAIQPQQDRFAYKNIPFAIAVHHSRSALDLQGERACTSTSIVPVLEDPELIHTALIFFKTNLNVTDAANALYVHRNTLLYRLQKITQLTGFDLKRFDDAVNFLALFGTCSVARFTSPS